MKSLYDAIKSMGYSLKYIKSIQVMSGDMAESYVDNIFNDIIGEVGQFSKDGEWKSDSYRILKNAVTETDGEYIVAINGNELLAVGVFKIEKMDAYTMSKLPEDIPMMKNFIHLKWLAGNGKGGGVTLINEIMQIAEAEGIILFLTSRLSSRGFYEMAGFSQSVDNSYYYWLPSSIRQVAKTG